MKPFSLLSLIAGLALPISAAEHSSGHGADQAAPPAADYPLKTCVVSDEALDSMGKPFELVYKEEGKSDRRVLLCCRMCEDDFHQDPAKYLAKLDAAEKEAAGK